MDKKAILTIDDDAGLQNFLCHYLEREGYHFISAMNGRELSQILRDTPPDIILLDLVMPHDNGLALLSMIRKQSKVPVIVISGKGEISDKIIGLEMGADDYLPKPFELRELSARISAVLRRTLPSGTPSNDDQENCISFNGWVLDRLQHQLFDEHGKSAELTSGEFKLLEAFASAPSRVLTREYLFELTRQGDFDSLDRVIDTQIGRIRKKINDNAQGSPLIKTIRGAGYMFVGNTRMAARKV